MAGDSIIDVTYEDFDVDSQLVLDAVNKRVEQSLVNGLNNINLGDLLPEVQAQIPNDLNQDNDQRPASDHKVLYDAHDSAEESDHDSNLVGYPNEPRLNIVTVVQEASILDQLNVLKLLKKQPAPV